MGDVYKHIHSSTIIARSEFTIQANHKTTTLIHNIQWLADNLQGAENNDVRNALQSLIGLIEKQAPSQTVKSRWSALTEKLPHAAHLAACVEAIAAAIALLQ
ncbi:hypothetical protein [Solidesulfovibrio sp.]|uniref:hypothetical protein n=1 Tax=Solidesulfovibrio sp. TaxID=2910990 RepID=UPI002B1F3FCF|nr:hypothetical protein [Solidesulfovibrio sp.]MEA4857507.1 hypothetical protein [Solidesulfovibrio sp.]